MLRRLLRYAGVVFPVYSVRIEPEYWKNYEHQSSGLLEGRMVDAYNKCSKGPLAALAAIAMLVLGACSALPSAPTPLPATTDSISQPINLLILDTLRPITVPAWQQNVMNMAVEEITDIALSGGPGAKVYFEIVAPKLNGEMSPTHIAGELKRSGSGGATGYVSMHLEAGALTFPDKYTLLYALEQAVTYKAEVRLVNGSINCCLQKPPIAVTGRFEGKY